MTDKEKKSKIADILMDFQEEYSNEVINRPMLASLYAGNILSFMNSLPNEPKKCMYTNEHYTDEDRKVLCEDCEERCEYSKKEEPVSEQNLSNIQRIGKNWKEELVSEDLEEELDKYIHDNFTIEKDQLDKFGIEEKDYMYSMDKGDMLAMIRHFVNWQKEQMMAKEEELEYVKYKLELRLPETLDYNGVQVDREDFINDFVKAIKKNE